MQTELIVVEPHWTVGQTIDYMRETPESSGSLFGNSTPSMPAASSRAWWRSDRLLRTQAPVPIAGLIEEDLRTVRATDDQEEAARMFERYDLVSAPVVDDGDRLVGVLTSTTSST